MEQIIVFTIGAVGYPIIETLWRGFSHWTMELIGGFCFVIIYYSEKKHSGQSMLKSCVTGALIITITEFVTGLIVNKLLGWDVWDYSGMPLNIMGQVCITYAALWFLMLIPIVYLCRLIRYVFSSGFRRELR